jgi:hypothetical protein
MACVEGMRIRVRSGREMKKQIRIKDGFIFIESCYECDPTFFNCDRCGVHYGDEPLDNCPLEDAE